MVEDCIKLVRKAVNLVEDTIRVEGILTVIKKSSNSKST